MKKYVVRGRKLRQYLQLKGFECKVDVDKNNPKYDVFLFDYTKPLLKEITNFTNKIHAKNK